MQTKTVDIHDVVKQLEQWISLVATGTEIILTDGSKPLARLVPLGQQPTPRIPGLHPGAITTSDDFDDPLPDEFWTGNT